MREREREKPRHLTLLLRELQTYKISQCPVVAKYQPTNLILPNDEIWIQHELFKQFKHLLNLFILFAGLDDMETYVL